MRSAAALLVPQVLAATVAPFELNLEALFDPISGGSFTGTP